MPHEQELDLRIKPVGTVRSDLKKPVLAFSGGDIHMRESHGPHGVVPQRESQIVINDSYTECLDGIEDFSHVLVLYWSHMVGEQGRHITKVHPAGQKDLDMVGVFSTRSPARPNPICATTVELLKRDGNVLRVRGLDAVDGSPVIDLKPHLPFFDAPQEVRLAKWMLELMQRFRGSD